MRLVAPFSTFVCRAKYDNYKSKIFDSMSVIGGAFVVTLVAPEVMSDRSREM